MPVAVIVDWYGPYTDLVAFRRMARNDWTVDGRTLYMALGRHNKVHYIGLTETPVGRICNRHDKLENADNRKFYIGEIVTQGMSGPRRRLRAPDLRLAEHALIRYLKPELNTNFIDTEPDDCVSVFSRFYDPDDWEKPTYPLPKFPGFVAYSWWSKEWLAG